VNEHPLSRLSLRTVDETSVRGRVGDVETGRFVESHTFGDDKDFAPVDDNPVCSGSQLTRVQKRKRNDILLSVSALSSSEDLRLARYERTTFRDGRRSGNDARKLGACERRKRVSTTSSERRWKRAHRRRREKGA
jgi:hypothetical protein